MKIFRLGLLLWIALSSTAWAQKEAPPTKPPEGETQKRPTLGPPTASSLNGPRSSTTTDPQKLTHMRKLFVERIDNQLSDKLMEGLSKTGRYQIVLDEKDADSVVRGSCLDSRRLKTIHSEVFISDRASGSSIWQDSVRSSFNPPSLDIAVAKSAGLILEHLNDSVHDAQRK
ncbi:MAG TPA: hypothetical protein VG028_18645 [Terriglobia bacterium]|nr:hypothetical protein [Terriglobia bacterium]